MFRPQAQGDSAGPRAGAPSGAGSRSPPSCGLPVGHGRGHEVHGRAADEPGHVRVGGAGVDLLRCGVLLHDAVVENDDLRGHGHGLDLVVGDVDEGLPGQLVQPDDFAAEFRAELGVEVGQRLVEQEH